jgi:preprotein translocase subunit SecA
MDELRTGIGLRGYGQRDPLVEYKQESYQLFDQLKKTIDTNIAKTILKVELQVSPTITEQPMQYEKPDPDRVGDITQQEGERLAEAAKVAKPVGHEKEIAEVSNKLMRGSKSVYDRMKQVSNTGTASTVKHQAKVGRNDPCPCGSGKKYKKCCGKLA